MALSIDLKPGESIAIGNATVTLESKSGQIARLVVHADRAIPVHRIDRSNAPARAAAHGLATVA